jgi:hypothetical protein
MIQLSAGTAAMTPMADPWATTAVGTARRESGNREGVGGDRIGRPLGGAEEDATGDQYLEAHCAQHRELQHRPEGGHDQQRVPGLDAVGDETDQYGREREHEEERRADQSELLGAELQLLHDRLGGEADHHLVGEVDQHEQKFRAVILKPREAGRDISAALREGMARRAAPSAPNKKRADPKVGPSSDRWEA